MIDLDSTSNRNEID